MNLFEVLSEDRDQLPNVKVVEIEAKNSIEKIVATLSGSQASSFTKIAKRYLDIQSEIKQLNEESNTLKKSLKEKSLGFFNARDALYTRFVTTSKYVARINAEFRGTKDKFDQRKYIRLLEELAEAQGVSVKELKEKCTETVEDHREAGFSIMTKDKSVLKEGWIDTIRNKLESFADKFISLFISKVDRKLLEIKREMMKDGLL